MKMKKLFRKNRKGISTVIATIIIVAISIVMAIAVAYWALGIGGSFTRFEKIQFVSAYANSDTSISMTIKNTGTATATLDPTTVFLNGQIITQVTGCSASFSKTTLASGDNCTGTLTLAGFNSGTTLEVKIQTASGNQYPQVVVLP